MLALSVILVLRKIWLHCHMINMRLLKEVSWASPMSRKV